MSDTLNKNPSFCLLEGIYGLLRVDGADASEFLNAQFCNDMSLISASQSAPGGYCNPKGRLLACLHIFKVGETYYLRMEQSVLDAVAKRLTMFVMRANVSIKVCSDADDIKPYFGLYGDCGEFIPNPPTQHNACVPFGDSTLGVNLGVVIRVPSADDTPRYEVYCADSAMPPMGKGSSDSRPDFRPDFWHQQNILAGLPVIYPKTSGLFVPQMANLDLIGALSYTKGCYPGQEVVARTHYLGKVKRRMLGFNSNHLPKPGDKVYVAGFSTDQASGEVVDACHSHSQDDAQVVGLMVVRLQGLDKNGDTMEGEVHFDAIDGPSAYIRPLPYAIKEETDTEK